MGKRLTACLLALCLAASLLCSVSAQEPEISVEIDQTGQDSAAAVIAKASIRVDNGGALGSARCEAI